MYFRVGQRAHLDMIFFAFAMDLPVDFATRHYLRSSSLLHEYSTGVGQTAVKHTVVSFEFLSISPGFEI